MDRFEFLRVNFFTPGQGKPAEDFPQVNGRRIYLKELSFRSQTKDNFDAIVRGFKEVQKRAKQRELEGEVKRSSSAQEQVPLQLLRPRCPTLRDLCMRPTYGSNARRTVGNLEAHVNGFRFSMKGGAEKVDILYSQLSHVIYEPCEKGSLIVLIHFHLKDAFMLGKKKTQDVQFFTEVTAQTEDLSIRKAGNMHDPDEIFEEQREREMKERLNKLFLDFSKEVERISTFPHAFDMPFKPLSFSGVPSKAVVTLTPCKGALVALQEWPPFCLSLSEVDIVVFERAIMTLREFDIVFVKRDYEQLPVRITTIPTGNMDTIKRWLGDIQAVWYSCSMNMQWAMVLKEVNKDTGDFIENGGWDPWFVGNAASDSGEEDDDESDFDASGANDGDDSDAGDDSDDDFSAEPDEESSDPASEEESGMSWDELEKEAERADRKRDVDKGDGGGGGKQPPRKSARKR
uniref:FACT complex subunit n=1 Tax=Alexandrium catenella TaxID=2925 RepID=A0A7S1PY18_ALECA